MPMPREHLDPVVLVCYKGRRPHPEATGVAMTAPISKKVIASYHIPPYGLAGGSVTGPDGWLAHNR
jgi:hypothetical protein